MLFMNTINQAKVLIHCQPSLLEFLEEKGFNYEYNGTEIDVIVDDLEYEIIDGIYQDPDEQLCELYGINYDQVNCIEAYNFCAI